MTLQIEDELIQYTAIKTDQPYAVLSCTRGILGTKAVAHPKGAKVHHLKECWSCFVPDGESTLFTEVAQRIATAVNTCGFDFVYLDGLDGAHVIDTEETRWHYGAKFTFEVFKYFGKADYDGDGDLPSPPLVRPLPHASLGPCDQGS